MKILNKKVIKCTDFNFFNIDRVKYSLILLLYIIKTKIYIRWKEWERFHGIKNATLKGEREKKILNHFYLFKK